MLVPKLRFQREDGTKYPEWEEKCIKDIAPLQRGFDLPEKERVNGKYPVVCSNGIVAYHNQYKCEGYAVITGRSGTIGNFTYLDNCKYWAHNTSLWVTDFCGNHPKFIYYFYHTIKIEQYATGTGVPTLNRNNVHSSRHYIPCLEEQQKIADFLSTVDEVIAQSEAEVQNIEQQKKAAMQKIFSQEARFKREDGSEYPEWEEKSLNAVCDIVGGGTPSTEHIEYWNGNIQWFTPSEIGKSKYVSESNRTISQLGFEKSSARKLPIGTILLTSRATLGEMAIATKECTTNQGFQSLVPQNIQGEYLYYLQPIIKNHCNVNACGSTFNEISKSELGKCKIPFPCFEEQQKIADFLSAYDEAISYAKQELEHWKQLKKGLLQQMFV